MGKYNVYIKPDERMIDMEMNNLLAQVPEAAVGGGSPAMEGGKVHG